MDPLHTWPSVDEEEAEAERAEQRAAGDLAKTIALMRVSESVTLTGPALANVLAEFDRRGMAEESWRCASGAQEDELNRLRELVAHVEAESATTERERDAARKQRDDARAQLERLRVVARNAVETGRLLGINFGPLADAVGML